MINGDSKGEIFLSHPHKNNGFFFFLHEIKYCFLSQIWTCTEIHFQFLAYGSWDLLFPISMSPNCKLMSPDHYLS